MTVSSREVTIHSHDSDSLRTVYILKRLYKSGFKRSVCEEALEECGGDEIAAMTALTRLAYQSVVTEEDPSIEIDPSMDLELERESELESLSAIYMDSVSTEKTEEGRVVTIQLSVQGSTKVQVFISNESSYPFELPGLLILNDSLPSYIRLGALKDVLKASQQFLGMPMIFSITSWVEDNLDSVVKNPPKLMSLREVTAIEHVHEPSFSRKVNLGQNKQRGSRSRVLKGSQEKSRKLLDLYNQRENDANYKKYLAMRKKLPSYKQKDEIVKVFKTLLQSVSETKV
jgi:ATP-dependent RNA helicase DHX57